ncbi:MAG: transcription antitermination factor NusB, partial [Planctomycetota bacterium]
DRRHSREWAIRLLYAFDQKGHADDGLLAVWDEDEDEASPAAREAGRELFNGFVGERPAVDAVVDGCLTNWTLGRLAVADRSLLRLGCFELLYRGDVPPKAAINEYIELAKRYGSDGKTAKLVNGVLDRIAREHRAGEVRARKD